MTARPSSLPRFFLPLLAATLLVVAASAKDKKKPSLPDYVLRASTVLVVVSPQAGEPLDQPMVNATARDTVEKALMEWGRLRPVMDGMEADLVIAVRSGSGRIVQPTIKGGPIDNRPGVGQSTDSSIRIGGQQGQPPPLNQPGMGGPQNGPHIGNEVGPSEDMFELYRGGVQNPLDSPPVWRYIAKDCLRAPKVSAVEEFRKLIAEAEKPQVPKKP
jgi:hypothetical protein